MMLGTRVRSAALVALFAIATPPSLLSGPNPQVKITIRGRTLAQPIEIAGGEPLSLFFYGHGPGNYSSQGRDYWAEPSFIVDWPRGTATEPSAEFPRYDVDFLTSRQGLNTYRVTYVYDAATQQGWVYLPGKTDPRYRENTWLLLRGIEGNWFHSWSVWDQAVQALIPNAR